MEGIYFFFIGLGIVLLLLLNIFFLYIPLATITNDLQSAVGTGTNLLGTVNAILEAPSITNYVECINGANNIANQEQNEVLKQQCEADLLRSLIADVSPGAITIIDCINANPTSPFSCFSFSEGAPPSVTGTTSTASTTITKKTYDYSK